MISGGEDGADIPLQVVEDPIDINETGIGYGPGGYGSGRHMTSIM
jgi:hypothetical protein